MHCIPEPSPLSPSDELVEAVDTLVATSRMRRWRGLVVLAGEREGGSVVAQYLLQRIGAESPHWFSDRPPSGVSASQGAAALRLLGTEVSALVFDAWSGFDPDAFGALCGTVRAGGLLLLLTPPLRQWPDFDDPQKQRVAVAPFSPQQVSGRYLSRLARVLEHEPRLVLCENGSLIRPAVLPVVPPAAGPLPAAPYRTRDQQLAVAALIRVATGHRRRPLVMVSDRGRGKSAAFGIAAAQLIQQGRRNIIVTGPGLASVGAVMQHAGALLSEPDCGALRFVAADELVRSPLSADMVLVDEAAALPAPLLEALLKRYARIAFATTVHGYEGTGRGFAVRFNKILDNNCNSWKTMHLTTPVRWAADDPLEALCFRLLLLDANAAPDAAFADADARDFSVETVDRDHLLEDEQLLAELFGLLVLAHYRTRPLDLRHLLDGPNISIHLLRVGGRIAATVLVADEGGFDADTAQAICDGKTRPHGHLLPETLAAYQGLCEASRLRCARVLRIAVHPALQRRGLGTRLIEHVTAQARNAGFDYVGSSFGASPELLDFWTRMQWLPVRIGFQRGASSGNHSVLVLNPLSEQGRMLAERARERFFAQFPHQLTDSLGDLEAELVIRLMRNGERFVAEPSIEDWKDTRAFAVGQRLLETSLGSVWRVVCFTLMDGRVAPVPDATGLTLLVTRVLQRHSWQYCVALAGVSGRGEALAVLRSAVAGLIGYYSDRELS